MILLYAVGVVFPRKYVRRTKRENNLELLNERP